MGTARYFDKTKVEKGMRLPFGVPMRDISEAEFNEYPKHVQDSIDTWDVFRRTNPAPTPRKAKGQDESEPSRLEPSEGGSQ